MKFKVFSHLTFAVSVGLLPTLVMAQDAPAPASNTTGNSDVVAEELSEVVVSAPLERSLFEQAQAITQLKGQGLQLALEPTLGQTLARTPGVSSSYFGPVASRPIIRGLDGDRVRILQNGLHTIDASATSVDHAVSFEPANLKSIEVVRGPATLLYGSNAIGGVVNAIDGRIVDERMDHTLQGSMGTRYTSVDNGYSGNFMLEGGHEGFAFHIEGYSRYADDLRIPGEARSARLQANAPLAPGQAEQRDVLPNSNSRSEGISGGGSYFWDGGFIGFALSRSHTNYGSPADPDVVIDMETTRLDVRGAFENPLPYIRKIDYRFAWSDYEHTEFEAGLPGTTFQNSGYDARVEITHEKIGPFEGVLGFQSDRSDFSALGAEAFLPSVLTQSNSAFLFEEIDMGSLKLQLGGRYDHITVESSDDPRFGPGSGRTFDNFSGSVGLIYTPTEDYSIALTGTYTERAPTYQELFANGEHVATGVFEIGDPTLGVESSLGLDLTFRKRTGWVTGSVGGYYNRFRNFIGLFPNGLLRDTDDPPDGVGDIPEFAFRGVDAEFYGAEMEATFHFLNPVTGEERDPKQTDLDLEIKADVVSARNLNTGDPLPRIPPFHLSGALVFQRAAFAARLEGIYAAPQNRVSANELPTDSYFLVNLALSYTVKRGPLTFDMYVKGTNLTDAEAREHTSFLKDVAPLAGRGLVVGLKTSF